MPRVTFQDLPLEVIFNIFNILLYSYQRKEYSRPYCPKADDEAHVPPFQWILPSIPLHSRTLSRFPYNVGAVSPVWHAVLTKIPECWTRVGFDVAKDPGDFVDVFMWSKLIPKIEVHVFTTASNPDEIRYEVERRRVQAISYELQPHIHRCRSIVFDVMYSTSLPPPVLFLDQDAPDLERLVLDCQVDNIDTPELYACTCDIGVRQYVEVNPSLALPKLQHLSIIGFWFMHTWNHPYTSTVLQRLPCSSLSITKFQFRQKGVHSLHHFISHFTRMYSFPAALHFHGLSLNYKFDSSVVREAALCDVFTYVNRHLRDVTFENVSPDCISTIFALTNVCPLTIHFERCVLPRDIWWEGVKCSLSFLLVNNVQDEELSGENMGNYNFLDEWPGETFSATSCGFVDDDFIDSLREIDLRTLKHLIIRDCVNFSATTLCRYIQARNRPWVDVDPGTVPSPSETQPLRTLILAGECPFPSQPQQLWIKNSGYTEPTEIHWQSPCSEYPSIVQSARFHG